MIDIQKITLNFVLREKLPKNSSFNNINIIFIFEMKKNAKILSLYGNLRVQQHGSPPVQIINSQFITSAATYKL